MSELAKKDILRVSNEESNRITRECIRTALLYLMGNKPYDKITITELVLRSGVSRMSFYRNYKTKDDVIKDICAEIRESFIKDAESGSFENDPKQWFSDFFATIAENRNVLMLIENSGLPLTAILKSLYDFDEYSSAVRDSGKYALAAKEGALLGIVIAWTHGGLSESPAEMADICLELLK